MAETSRGSSIPPDAGQVDGQAEQVGAVGERRQGPGEGQGEVELVRRVLVLGQAEHRVLEGQQGPRVDLEGQVEVERAAAAVLGVELHLPDLAQGVGLDEVALVVHVESVIDRVVLQIGHVSGHIDDCHRDTSLPAIGCPGDDAGSRTWGAAPGGGSGNVAPWTTPHCSRCCTPRPPPSPGRWGTSTTGGWPGTKADQYRHDLAADAAGLGGPGAGRGRRAVRGVGHPGPRP